MSSKIVKFELEIQFGLILVVFVAQLTGGVELETL
jgi:hypothetical protein